MINDNKYKNLTMFQKLLRMSCEKKIKKYSTEQIDELIINQIKLDYSLSITIKNKSLNYVIDLIPENNFRVLFTNNRICEIMETLLKACENIYKIDNWIINDGSIKSCDPLLWCLIHNYDMEKLKCKEYELRVALDYLKTIKTYGWKNYVKALFRERGIIK